MAERRHRRGERVRFFIGTHSILGTIQEDRGTLGVRGERIYRIVFPPDVHPPFTEVELSADEFEPAEPTAAAK